MVSVITESEIPHCEQSPELELPMGYTSSGDYQGFPSLPFPFIGQEMKGSLPDRTNLGKSYHNQSDKPILPSVILK